MESLLLCALPYHGTNEFVRLVQTLALGSTKQGGWMWLAPIQTSGAALPREVLVKRCVNDAVGYARKPWATSSSSLPPVSNMGVSLALAGGWRALPDACCTSSCRRTGIDSAITPTVPT